MQEAESEGKKLSAPEMAKQLGQKWSEMTEEEKKIYTDRHEQAMQEFRSTLEEQGLTEETLRDARSQAVAEEKQRQVSSQNLREDLADEVPIRLTLYKSSDKKSH